MINVVFSWSLTRSERRRTKRRPSLLDGIRNVWNDANFGRETLVSTNMAVRKDFFKHKKTRVRNSNNSQNENAVNRTTMRGRTRTPLMFDNLWTYIGYFRGHFPNDWSANWGPMVGDRESSALVYWWYWTGGPASPIAARCQTGRCPSAPRRAQPIYWLDLSPPPTSRALVKLRAFLTAHFPLPFKSIYRCTIRSDHFSTFSLFPHSFTE